MDISGTINGKTYGIAFIAHPQNPVGESASMPGKMRRRGKEPRPLFLLRIGVLSLSDSEVAS